MSYELYRNIGLSFQKRVREALFSLNQLPSQTWVETGHCSDYYDDLFSAGCCSSILCLQNEDPYEPSNHERDTSFNDNLNYHFWCGYNYYSELDVDEREAFLNKLREKFYE